MADLGRILIADDEESFLRSTAKLLRRKGYKCTCVPDGAAAADMLKKEEYDALISDIRMPGNPQLELIKALPQIAKGLPVILTTAYPSLSSAIESIGLPVVSYLIKPFDIEELLDNVVLAIRRSKVYRAVHGARQRLRDWDKELTGLDELTKLPSRDASPVSLDAFLDLTFGNVAGTLSDIRRLVETIPWSEARPQACHLLDCPRLDELTDALKETVEVLHRSKAQFKSKNLGGLRERLERIV